MVMDFFSKRRSLFLHILEVGILSSIIVWIILIAGSCKAYPSTYVEGDNCLIVFKDLNITMDKYVLHSYFHDIYMDEVYIILEHPWME